MRYCNSKGQSVLSMPSPWAGDISVLDKGVKSGSELYDAINRTYLANLPLKMNVSQTLSNVTGVAQGTVDYDWGISKLIDIQFPLMNSCRPKASKLHRVAPGLICKDAPSCQTTHQVSLEESYESTLGFKIGATITGETDFKVVKASISMTFEASYEQKWSRGSSKSNSYTFNLQNGQTCTPSMVHVNLECDVMSDIIYYDTFWERGGRTNMWLEEYHQRTGGPYNKGQWCRGVHIREDILDQDQYFAPVLKEDSWRGAVWLRPSSQLNDYKTNPSEPDIPDDDIVIRRGKKGRGGPFNEVFVCRRYLPSTKQRKVTLPLGGEGESMFGFVACVA